jgi:multisubunit Na+/H+ antiporter MnhC subunit
VIVTLVVRPANVAMLKSAMSAPDAIVTDGGTRARDVSLLESRTDVPPTGAGPVRIKRPREGCPPTRLPGFNPNALSLGAWTVTTAVFDTPLEEAVIVTAVVCATGTVVTPNPASECPCVTVAVAGTLPAAALLLESWTFNPPIGAMLPMLTFPITMRPPTVVSEGRKLVPDWKTRPVTGGGTRVNSTLFVTPAVPVMVAVICCGTGWVTTVNAAEPAPAATVTDCGTAMGPVRKSVTICPPGGAGAVSVALAVTLESPLCGSTVMPLRTGGKKLISALCVAPFAVALMVTAIDCAI